MHAPAEMRHAFSSLFTLLFDFLSKFAPSFSGSFHLADDSSVLNLLFFQAILIELDSEELGWSNLQGFSVSDGVVVLFYSFLVLFSISSKNFLPIEILIHNRQLGSSGEKTGTLDLRIRWNRNSGHLRLDLLLGSLAGGLGGRLLGVERDV